MKQKYIDNIKLKVENLIWITFPELDEASNWADVTDILDENVGNLCAAIDELIKLKEYK